MIYYDHDHDTSSVPNCQAMQSLKTFRCQVSTASSGSWSRGKPPWTGRPTNGQIASLKDPQSTVSNEGASTRYCIYLLIRIFIIIYIIYIYIIVIYVCCLPVFSLWHLLEMERFICLSWLLPTWKWSQLSFVRKLSSLCFSQICCRKLLTLDAEDAIEGVKTTSDDKPIAPITIARCGAQKLTVVCWAGFHDTLPFRTVVCWVLNCSYCWTAIGLFVISCRPSGKTSGWRSASEEEEDEGSEFKLVWVIVQREEEKEN